MESSYSAFLSDPFLSCVGSMMKIDETWCQPLSEGHSARPSSTVLLPPTKTAQQLNFKGETEFAYDIGTLSQGTLLPKLFC